MVIGESRYFDLAPVGGALLGGYSAIYEIVQLDKVVRSDVVNKSADNKKFEVRIQTEGLSAGSYTLRIKATDSVDDFTSIIYSEKLSLTK